MRSADFCQFRSALLPRNARGIVDAAAVLAVPTSLALLGAVAQLTPAQSFAALGSGADSGSFVELEQNHYGLRHAVAVQAVYDSIPLAARSRLHLHAAQVVKRASPASAVSLARDYHATIRPLRAASRLTRALMNMSLLTRTPKTCHQHRSSGTVEWTTTMRSADQSSQPSRSRQRRA